MCGQIYKEWWRYEVGQVKKVWGDTLEGGNTRVKAIKSDSDSDSDEQERSPSFSGKNRGVTPSVAAPGVTHPSDATACPTYVTHQNNVNPPPKSVMSSTDDPLAFPIGTVLHIKVLFTMSSFFDQCVMRFVDLIYRPLEP